MCSLEILAITRGPVTRSRARARLASAVGALPMRYRPTVRFSQRLRARLIGLVSMALLSSQIAVAAYACPAMGDRFNRDTADTMAMAGMPCAEMMAAGVPLDPEQPALCLQHCQFGTTTQVVDHVPPAFVPVTTLPALFEVSLDQGLDTVLSAWAEDERLRDRPPPLALSIAHCCFRI